MNSRISILLLLFISSCVYLPETVTEYDETCQASFKQLKLEEKYPVSLHSCHNSEACVIQLALIGVVTAGSYIVSGSVVVTGNMLYWYEKQAQCEDT